MVESTTLGANITEHATVRIGEVSLAASFVERANRLIAAAAYLNFNLENIINNVGCEIPTQYGEPFSK
mgnify:CR=1 FL=1